MTVSLNAFAAAAAGSARLDSTRLFETIPTTNEWLSEFVCYMIAMSPQRAVAGATGERESEMSE